MEGGQGIPSRQGQKGEWASQRTGKKKLLSLLLPLLLGAIFFFQLSFLCCSLLPLLHSRGCKTNLVGVGVGGLEATHMNGEELCGLERHT